MLALRTALGLAVLVVVAGCTGSGAGTAPPVSVTPAPVPSDGTPTPAYRLAPGLSADGVVGPLALASAHDELLRSSDFHVRITERVEPSDGPTRRRVLEGTYVNRTSYRLRVWETVGNRTVLTRSLYADGTALYERHVTANAVRYYLTNERLDDTSPYPPDRLGGRTQRETLYIAFVGARPEFVGELPADDGMYYHIAATRAVRPGLLAAWAYVDAVSDYEFDARVTGAGLVRSYRLRYVATVGDDRRRVVRTARWTDVGTATVRRPDWYATALNRTAA